MDIFTVLETNGFVPCILDDGLECSGWTPAGENYTFYLHGKTEEEWANELKKIAREFDVDEHVELWSNERGKNGVPGTFSELIEDAKWIANKFEEMVNGIK